MRTEKLQMWQERLRASEAAYEAELYRMDERDALYQGKAALRPITKGDTQTKAYHVRNICAELIEAQISDGIPRPKVTACRREDEPKAKLIEDMLRNELDRLPFERLNDILSRVVLIQGGGGILLEWDNTRTSHSTVGELSVSPIHPRQFIPQEGVYSSVEDMDYFILKIPQTKEGIRRKYGVCVEEESESEPEVKGPGENAASEMVTQYMAYYRNESGGIGMFSWVNDVTLADHTEYQARLREEDGAEPQGGFVLRSDGSMIPTEQIPPYSPRLYPLILVKNVSVFGKLLGDSDIDKIADQQNTTNRIESKIIDKLMKSGSYITLPDDASIRADAEDMKVIRPGNAAEKSLIDVYDLQGNIHQDMLYLSQVYEEARQALGITDSFLGRADRTAVSGRAKEIAASQSAGRLESKRAMKEAAYAELFEAMFRFKLAYADEPRPVVSGDLRGNPIYSEFNRYDFLERDAAGALYWNDRFLFSCDRTDTQTGNRELMWQETRLNLQSGAFGNPTALETLVLFWSRMELLHYPGAAETKAYLNELRAGSAN